MSSKLDWEKADGNASFDEDTGKEWRRGPLTPDFSMPDITVFDLTAAPKIDWSRLLRARFKVDTDEGHNDMMAAAQQTVDRLCQHYHLDMLKTRSRQYMERAGQGQPFPALWFAFYFDVFAGRRYRRLRPECMEKGTRDTHFTLKETFARWRWPRTKKALGCDAVLEMHNRYVGKSSQTGRPR